MSYRICSTADGEYTECDCPVRTDAGAPPASDAGVLDAGTEVDAGPTCLSLLESEYDASREPLPEPSETEQTEMHTDDGLELTCRTVTRDAWTEPSDIVALGPTYGSLQPGVIVDSQSVRAGVPELISLPRAPIDLFIDLPVASAIRRVENPTSASLRMAVGELIREADPVLGSLPEIPATLAIDVFEAETFEEARSSLGIAAEFSSPLFSSDFSADFGSSRSVRERTAVVRLYQPMFTISVAEDAVVSNRDFFHPDLSFAEGGLACSQLSSGIPPAILSSVTYGRLTLFTVTSREVRSSETLATKLRAALSAVAVGGEIDTSTSDEYSELMSSASIRFVTFGGSQEYAFSAIRSGDFREFFRASRSIQAVPIAHRFNYLSDGRPPLTIRMRTSSSSVCCTPTNCPEPPSSYHEYLHEELDTGWHWEGTPGAVWGERGGPCTAGRTRLRVDSTVLGGTPWEGKPGCWYEWVTDDPADCRARLWYSRSGTSFIHCEWRIYEQQPEPHLHEEPLCRSTGGSCGS
jgi:hypothetical protein